MPVGFIMFYCLSCGGNLPQLLDCESRSIPGEVQCQVTIRNLGHLKEQAGVSGKTLGGCKPRGGCTTIPCYLRDPKNGESFLS